MTNQQTLDDFCVPIGDIARLHRILVRTAQKRCKRGQIRAIQLIENGPWWVSKTWYESELERLTQAASNVQSVSFRERRA